MKKAFTLVELLVVVVVIVTLMSITFRLAGAGGDSSARNYTINRMQRLENCLSGYYAAFGSYPPVKLHGSRDFTYKVNRYGIQSVGLPVGAGKSQKGASGANSTEEHETDLVWKSVEAACRSQPLGIQFPYTRKNMGSYVSQLSKLFMSRANSSDPAYKAYQDRDEFKSPFGVIERSSDVDQVKTDCYEWPYVQLFKFGVMSFILPRYQVMLPLRSDATTQLDDIYDEQKAWWHYNEYPCDIKTGVQYGSWKEFISDVRGSRNLWKVATLPSQAVCARWIQNLENQLCMTYHLTLYGVQLHNYDEDDNGGLSVSGIKVYSMDNQGSNQYVLDNITMVDGWGNEFYYYSQPPYQSYRLWSAGPNGKTFPPWVTDKEFDSLRGMSVRGGSKNAFETVQEWMSDDIMQMSN